jgi:hypothetical protein
MELFGTSTQCRRNHDWGCGLAFDRAGEYRGKGKVDLQICNLVKLELPNSYSNRNGGIAQNGAIPIRLGRQCCGKRSPA